ncbi:DUF6221 family protein [Streptomyces sp. NPDC019507]|uniref:DUF6221 family protein n=1 Tax=Streptomyces sp. NPDC019507 TaxID=3154689 RepID=UPI0033F1563D
MELVEFLRARLDEDSTAAEAAAAERGPVWWYEGHFADLSGQVLAGEVLDGGSAVVRALTMTTRSDAEGEHIARHDPARVLAEVESKRQLVTGYALSVQAVEELTARREQLKAKGYDLLMTDMDLGSAVVRRDTLTGVVRLLALPYASHPDYDEAWRP